MFSRLEISEKGIRDKIPKYILEDHVFLFPPSPICTFFQSIFLTLVLSTDENVFSLTCYSELIRINWICFHLLFYILFSSSFVQAFFRILELDPPQITFPYLKKKNH